MCPNAMIEDEMEPTTAEHLLAIALEDAAEDLEFEAASELESPATSSVEVLVDRG